MWEGCEKDTRETMMTTAVAVMRRFFVAWRRSLENGFMNIFVHNCKIGMKIIPKKCKLHIISFVNMMCDLH